VEVEKAHALVRREREREERILREQEALLE
jgi:hypothetical protein